MAIDQERAAHEFWVQWKDKHPCYCGALHSRDCYMKFAASYAAECVRAERERCLDIVQYHTFERVGTDFERGAKVACERIAAAIEKED